jgi:hypothetical protein
MRRLLSGSAATAGLMIAIVLPSTADAFPCQYCELFQRAVVEITPAGVGALGSIANGGTYAPTDPNDGDPGGATGSAGVDRSLALAAQALLANPTQANLARFDAAATGPSATTTDVLAAGAVACAKHVFAQTVVHTRKTALAFSQISCNVAAAFSDSFNWFSTDTGTVFDFSAGQSTKPGVFSFIDASTTQGGRRGHRDVTFCSSEATQSGSASSCTTPPFVKGHGV